MALSSEVSIFLRFPISTKIKALAERLRFTIERTAHGDPEAGPIAALDTTARFHWLVAPSSTIIQPSAVHTGMCGDPTAELDKLYRELVAQLSGDSPSR